MVEDDLRDERARLQVTPPLALEQIPLGADHWTLLETLEQTLLGGGRHRDLLRRDGTSAPYASGRIRLGRCAQSFCPARTCGSKNVRIRCRAATGCSSPRPIRPSTRRPSPPPHASTPPPPVPLP